MIQICLHIDYYWIKELDNLVEKRLYPNRNEAIRYAIRDLVQSEHKIKRFGKGIDSL